jgi:hypothetical protein
MMGDQRSDAALLSSALPDLGEERMQGTIRKIGLEGGVWALITDDGRQVELIDAPPELKKNGVRAEVEGDRRGADVTIGMLGDSIRVKSFRLLE